MVPNPALQKFAHRVPPIKAIENGLPVFDGKHAEADPIKVAAPVDVFML